MNQLDLKGRTAVVSGGMQGIGAAIVKRMESSGAKVAVWDLDHADKVDVSSPSSVEKAVERTLNQLGRIDILVNNAGVAGLNAPTVDYPVEEWGGSACCVSTLPASSSAAARWRRIW